MVFIKSWLLKQVLLYLPSIAYPDECVIKKSLGVSGVFQKKLTRFDIIGKSYVVQFIK